jgi:CheY-like chemotaxis protein
MAHQEWPDMSRVLVVDDEEQFRKLARRLLEAEGHEVIEASSGQEGIDQFRAVSPDIVVTDIVMPGKSGIDAIEQIREENPSVRIIAISGSGGIAAAGYLNTARKAGANETLAKPFRADEFLAAVSPDKH